MRLEQPRPATPDEIDQQRFLRDITSLLALPAIWSGTEPSFVLRTFFEALEALAVDVCYGFAITGAGERLQILHVQGRPVAITDAEWAPFVKFGDATPGGETVDILDIGARRLHCMRLPIGYAGESGRIAVGSWRPSFPDSTQIAILHTALGLVAAGLETARLIRERDEAQRAKDEFLAMLGHELRNPLAPIVTALQLMALKAGGQRSREHEIIDRQVRHLRTLVDDLLDVSRITRGKIDLHPERIDLRDVVTRAIEVATPLIEERHHDLRVRVPEGLVINGDPTRMAQVVVNLLTNAAKYTLPGGSIQVSAAADDQWITLRVIDNGTGLTPELLPRVFDLFVQGRRDLGRSTGGLGIGLALVKRLVQAHGGAVSAHSEGSARGSEFVVTLPAASSRALEPSARSADRLHLIHHHESDARVLVVDDNRDAADLVASALQAAGYRVDVAYSGREALRHVATVMPEVMVLDIGLPDIDGYAVAADLRARYPDAPVRLIALTGYGQVRDHGRSAQAGFSAHLVKPVDPLELAAVIRRSLDAGAPSVAPAGQPDGADAT